MSVAEILTTAERLETQSLEKLYQQLSFLRTMRKNSSVLNETETLLLSKINDEFDTKKWDRLQYLDWKLESAELSIKEENELLKLAKAYEQFSVDRLKNIAQLALLKQIPIESLIEQLGIKA